MRTILIVEDELSIVRMLSFILREEGFEVVAAGNGAEALERLQETRPDVILSDMMMPVMGGAELCRWLHAHPEHSLIPLVLMSSAYNSIDVDGCGPAAFVKKPFVLDVLLKTLSKASGAEWEGQGS